MQRIGCRHVKVNELQHTPDLYVSFEDITATRMPSPFAHGCQTDLPLRDGMRVTVKRSCFITETTRTASAADTVKMAARQVIPVRLLPVPRQARHDVLYEDGRLERGWITGG
jgi:hypothetical protein